MNTETLDNSPSENPETSKTKHTEVQTILHQLIRMLAIEIATKIKATKT
jgi:hypothetical protein